MTMHELKRRHAAEQRELIEQTVRACGGNRTAAAKMLGINRSHLSRLCSELALDVPAPDHGVWAKGARHV